MEQLLSSHSAMELELSAAGEAGEEDTGSLRIRSATLGPLSLKPGGGDAKSRDAA